MDSPLACLADLVAEQGMDPVQATTIAAYIADRCAGISLASAHSSPHSALRNDEFLTSRLALSRSQISAWLALVRGTRAVRRGARSVGGQPGFVEAVARGAVDERQWQRFTELARRAAGNQGRRCGRPVPSPVGRRARPVLVAPCARP